MRRDRQVTLGVCYGNLLFDIMRSCFRRKRPVRGHSEHSNAPNIPLNVLNVPANVLYVIESRTPTKKQADSGQTRNDAKDKSRMEKKTAAVPLIYSPREPRGAQQQNDVGRAQAIDGGAEASMAGRHNRPAAHTSHGERGDQKKPTRGEPRHRTGPASRREARGAAEVKGARRGGGGGCAGRRAASVPRRGGAPARGVSRRRPRRESQAKMMGMERMSTGAACTCCLGPLPRPREWTFPRTKCAARYQVCVH